MSCALRGAVALHFQPDACPLQELYLSMELWWEFSSGFSVLQVCGQPVVSGSEPLLTAIGHFCGADMQVC